jgi:NADPH:quinone reductase-like Zn-dependent oxidoreductase
MKAVWYERYGPPEVLSVREIEPPVPGENDLLIAIKAAEITKADCELRSFQFPVKWFWLPLRLAMGLRGPRKHVQGGYFSGVVEKIGQNVKSFQPGDEIFGSAGLHQGVHAEFAVLPESCTLARKPPNISFYEAAAIPLGGLNALHFMRKAGIKPGEKVLVNGAGGSIGCYALQIARDMGAVVHAVDAGHKESLAMSLGVEQFFNYERTPIGSIQGQYEVVFDMVASSDLSHFMRLLAPGGRYLTANPTVARMLKSLYVGRSAKKSILFAFAGEKREELQTLADLLAEKRIKPVVDRIYPLEQIVEAHHHVASEERLGPVVLAM